MEICSKKQANIGVSSNYDKTLWWSRLWEEMYENAESWYKEEREDRSFISGLKPDLKQYQKNVQRINDVYSGQLNITNLPRRCGYSTSVLLLALETIANSDDAVDILILTSRQESADLLRSRLFYLERYMSDFVFDAGLFISPSTSKNIVFVESHKTGHRSKIAFNSRIFTGTQPDVIMIDH